MAPEETIEQMLGGNVEDDHYMLRGGSIVPLVSSAASVRSIEEVQSAAVELVVALDSAMSFTANGAMLFDRDGSGTLSAFEDHQKHWYYRTSFSRNKLLIRRADATTQGVQPFRANAPFSAEQTQPDEAKRAFDFPEINDNTVAASLNRGVSQISIFGLNPKVLPFIKDAIVRRTSCPGGRNMSAKEMKETLIEAFEIDVTFSSFHIRDAIPSLDGCDWEIKIRLR